jgi:penicillin-binding protein 1A
VLADSFVVMEDRDFYNHSGIDIKAIIRAIIANRKSDTIVQGASTITQQVAKNVFLSQEVTWERKIKEIFLAWELEKMYSKEQILEFYLNNIYFSNGYYGVEAAAKGYFGKSVSELSVSEQAFIAAIPNNPTKYNPLTNYDATLSRRNLILKELRDADYIDSMTYNTAVEEDIVVTGSGEKVSTKNNSVETYARHCATEELMKYYGFVMRNNFDSEDEYNEYEDLYQKYYSSCQQMLINGGYTVYTSIDPDAQEALQNSIDKNLAGYTTVGDDGVYEFQGAATCIDNSTGNVVAIVGSRSQELDGYTLNRAYQSYRQPGSSIKPIVVYTPYLQQGNTPDTIVTDEKIDGGPNNADGSYAGQMTLRTAVMKSKNTVAWKIYRDDITPKMGIGFLLNMGFHRVWMDKSTNAVALGGFTYGVSTEEMAGAYATIINDGMYRQPTCVTKITNTSGRAIVDTSDREVRVYDTNSCRMMTDMLRSVVTGGTGVGAEPSNAIVAGKTGTTNGNKDAYFCGYSQYYTMAVWTGYDYPKTQNSVKTISIFRDFMEAVHKGKEKVEFKTASGVTTKQTKTETQTQTQEETTATEEETTTQIQATTQSQTQKTTAANTASSSAKATEKRTQAGTDATKRTGEWDAPTQTDKAAQ